MMSAFFHFQHTLNRLFDSYIKLYKVILILDKLFLKYEEGGQIDPLHPLTRRNYPQKAQSY